MNSEQFRDGKMNFLMDLIFYSLVIYMSQDEVKGLLNIHEEYIMGGLREGPKPISVYWCHYRLDRNTHIQITDAL